MTTRAHPLPWTIAPSGHARYAAPGAAQHWRSSPGGVLSLRGMTLELWVILAYVVVTGVGDLQAAKFGVQVGPVPIFLTDITLLVLLVVSFVRRPARTLYWVSEGIGAGPVGRAVWILCILAVVYFALAFPEYHLYAVHDLAIFCYSLFFPFTCFAIRDSRDAARLLRYFTYSGVVVAVMLLLQGAVGGFHGHFELQSHAPMAVGHGWLGRLLLGVQNEDAGALSIFSLAALSAYTIFESQLRRFHVVCLISCFLALSITTSRAGVVAVVLASSVTFLCARTSHRVRYALLVALLVFAVLLAPTIPASLPGAGLLRQLRVAVLSAASGPSVDPTSRFRMRRWEYTFNLWLEHPVFGVGFGSPILAGNYSDRKEHSGKFNVGMPHNTFLFVAARMGIVGLALVLFCWFSIFRRLLARFRRTLRADTLAAANVLAAMFGFAMFVLFFERPVTNVAFWIVMAASARLIDFQAPHQAGKSA